MPRPLIIALVVAGVAARAVAAPDQSKDVDAAGLADLALAEVV